MWNIEKWKMKNSCLISKQNVAIWPTKSKMRRLTLNELLNASGLRDSIIFRRESQPKHLKRWFFLKNRPVHFHINSTRVRQANGTSWVFPTLKLTSHFLPQSTVSRTSDLSAEANSSSYNRPNAWSHLEQRVVSSA